jgi:hypothetical protein
VLGAAWEGFVLIYSGYKLINISAVKFILAAKVDKPSLGKEGFPSVKETQNAN